jgi:ferric-dicitrate binding protein FerR (iron transport regulator)
MQPNRLKHLFRKYLSGDLTTAENTEWLQFVSDDNNTTAIRSLIDEIVVTDVPANQQTPEKADSIFNAITAHKTPVIPTTRTHILRRLTVAASIILVAGLLVFQLSKPRSHSTIAQTATYNDSLVRSVAQKRRYIVLADGSHVILNQRSTLSHPASFANNTREVYLTGEGYFDISHDDHKPFIVHTGDLRIVVLGTAFNIKAYKDQPNITVTVTQGKVRLENSRHSIGVITPNQQITVDAGSGEVKQATVNAQTVTHWGQKELVFDDMPLNEVAVALEMQFKVAVVFDDPALKNLRITASFLNGEPLDQVLEVITKVNKIKYHIKDSSVLISGGSQINQTN